MDNLPASNKSCITSKILILVFALLSLYAAVVSTARIGGAAPKIGYINLNNLLEKYDGAVRVTKEMQDQTQPLQAKLKALETELGKLNEEVTAMESSNNQVGLASKRATLAKKQEEWMRFRREISEKVSGLQQQLMQPILDELNGMMKDFGREKNYQLILGTGFGGNILYAQESVNLTDAFLLYANAKKAKEKK